MLSQLGLAATVTVDNFAPDGCICENICAEDNINQDCPNCSKEGENLSACKGKESDKDDAIVGSPDEDIKSDDVIIAVTSLVISGFSELTKNVTLQTASYGTTLDGLNLPDNLTVISNGKTITINDVTWELDVENPANSGNATYDHRGGIYVFIPVLTEGYKLAGGVSLPEIRVIVVQQMQNRIDGQTADFSVVGGVLNTDYFFADGVLTVNTATAITISGITTTDKIVVSTGVSANITLGGVNIDVSETNKVTAFELQDNATVNLTLADGSENKLKSGEDKAGLQVPQNAIATIKGTGSLTAHGGESSARIGGESGMAAGTINIEGGNILAFNGSEGVPIGSTSAGGTVNISGGQVLSNIVLKGGTVNISKGVFNGANIDTGDNGTIIISDGSVTPSDNFWSGIRTGENRTIKITGGNVTAIYGNDGIGGIQTGNGGTIEINGGTVNTKEIAGGTFSTGINGNAYITVTKSLAYTNQNEWSGVVFQGNSGMVYGSSTIQADTEISSLKTLTIPNGKTLIVPSGVTLTNVGTIEIANTGVLTINEGGKLINKGIINNEGTIASDGLIYDYGDIKGTQPGGNVVYLSQVTVTFTKGDGSPLDIPNIAAHGTTVKINATMEKKTRAALPNTVDFYLGSVDDENKLNNDVVNVSGSTASLELKLTGEEWSIGSKTIIVDFGGMTSLLSSQGQANLKVTKGTPDYVTPSWLTATFGQTLSDVTLTPDFSWQSATNTPVGNPGNNDFHVTYTPADTTNYNIIRDIEVSIAVEPTSITIPTITGVIAPLLGDTFVAVINETKQYTGTIAWNPSDNIFTANTQYTATITLNPKTGYTLTGVWEDFFTVNGARATNSADSGVITAVLPTTGKAPIDISNITGVIAPVLGDTFVAVINETKQYTGTIAWNPSDNIFTANTQYTATITLNPKTGYTLTGVEEDFFTVNGAIATNSADSGVITAVFPITGSNIASPVPTPGPNIGINQGIIRVSNPVINHPTPPTLEQNPDESTLPEQNPTKPTHIDSTEQSDTTTPQANNNNILLLWSIGAIIFGGGLATFLLMNRKRIK